MDFFQPAPGTQCGRTCPFILLVLYTGVCNSVDSTILKFEGAILIFWFLLANWLDWFEHQNYSKIVLKSSSLEGVGPFLGDTTDIYLDRC